MEGEQEINWINITKEDMAKHVAEAFKDNILAHRGGAVDTVEEAIEMAQIVAYVFDTALEWVQPDEEVTANAIFEKIHYLNKEIMMQVADGRDDWAIEVAVGASSHSVIQLFKEMVGIPA